VAQNRGTYLGSMRTPYLRSMSEEEDDHRDAAAAVDPQFPLSVRVGVPVEVADAQGRGGRGDVLEDGALAATVAAPGPGQAQHAHRPAEGGQQGPLPPPVRLTSS
jgi:hypothetical protein